MINEGFPTAVANSIEHLTHIPKIKVVNPAADTRNRRLPWKVLDFQKSTFNATVKKFEFINMLILLHPLYIL